MLRKATEDRYEISCCKYRNHSDVIYRSVMREKADAVGQTIRAVSIVHVLKSIKANTSFQEDGVRDAIRAIHTYYSRAEERSRNI